MGALAQFQAQDNSWIPQDDILLKTPVVLEADASLQPLTKGAARFTVQELEDSCNGVLHDPFSSTESYTQIAEIEHSKENRCFSEKRKFEAVSQQDNFTRKRNCKKPLHSTDLGSFTKPDSSNILENREQPLTSRCVRPQDSNFDIVDPESTKIAAATSFSIDASDIIFCAVEDASIDQNNFQNIIAPEENTAVSGSPVWDAIEGMSSPILTDFGSGDSFEKFINELEYDLGLSESILENQLSCDDTRNLDSSTDNYLKELSNFLFDFTNEEDIHLTDSDGQNWPSLLNPEYCYEAICCTLNTEDPDIPCNDDVFLLTHPSFSEIPFASEMQRKTYEPPPHPRSSLKRNSPIGQIVNASRQNQRMSESWITPDNHQVTGEASNPFVGPTQSSLVDHGGCNLIPHVSNEMVLKTEQTNCLDYNPDGFSDLLVEVDTTNLSGADLAITNSLANQDEFQTWNEDYSDIEAVVRGIR